MSDTRADPPNRARNTGRLHGRVAGDRACAAPGCTAAGEFRAPDRSGSGNCGDGPPAWQWLCLDHVRAFNTSYNYFSGMSADEIEAAQRPYAGWERETRAFAAAGMAPNPRWADFVDPLDAIGAKVAERLRPRADGRPLNDGDRRNLKLLGLGPDTDRRELRTRYAELVRRYHPDRNGGDRSHERALQEVIAAYSALKSRPLFA